MITRIIVASVLAAGLMVSAALAAPAGPGMGVPKSVHDMNQVSSNPDAEGRVCAFCHTPHHALSDAEAKVQPLWSHAFTAAETGVNVVPYVSPYTLDSNGNGIFNGVVVEDTLVGASRLCMSCHDGVIAIDQHYGAAGTDVRTSDAFGGIAIGKQNAGGNYDFSNDHPIGFQYDTAQTDAAQYTKFDGTTHDRIFTNDKTFFKSENLRGTKTIGSALWNGYMTCATCHDVHNKENATHSLATRNYLVFAPQEGSLLCLSCHDKGNGL